MSLLTEEEVKKLLTVVGSEQGDLTKEQAVQVVRWAEQARCSSLLLEGVLSGDLVAAVIEGEKVGFKLTVQGQKKARSDYAFID